MANIGTLQGVPAHDDHTDASFRRALPKTVNAAGIGSSSERTSGGKSGRENVAINIGKNLRAHGALLMQELRMHDGIEAALVDAGLVFEREFKLGPRDRLDFWLPNEGLVVEVKKGLLNLGDLRQVGRYFEDGRVTGGVLIAMRFSNQIPATFSGKPLEQVALWRYLL